MAPTPAAAPRTVAASTARVARVAASSSPLGRLRRSSAADGAASASAPPSSSSSSAVALLVGSLSSSRPSPSARASSSSSSSAPSSSPDPQSSSESLPPAGTALRPPPPAIASIPSGTVRRHRRPYDSSLPGPISPAADDAPSFPSAAFRDVGCTRRLFLLNPYFTSDELSGLSYRIRTLGKNSSINSILIAATDDDDVASGLIPTSAIDADRTDFPVVDESGWDERTGYGKVWFVSGGYDPLELYKSGGHRDESRVDELLKGVSDLALATRGDYDGPDGSRSRVPVIAVPHGAIVDGGYALCTSSYVLATRDSSFRIASPSRGLSFDPVGFSYILPRLGHEFNQPSASYPAGKLLALTGWEANASDMMETGLATHYLDSPIKVGMLERILSELPPWEQQALLKNPTRPYGSRKVGSNPWDDEREDANRVYKNVAVANAIHACTVYDARGRDVWGEVKGPEFDGRGEDPSVVLERESAAGEFVRTRDSHLVNVAATFEDALNSKSLVELLERFKEIRSSHERSDDPDEREVAELANDAITRMERRSPLALRATFRLLEIGANETETLESCMERERTVQSKLLRMDDFERWGASAVAAGVEDAIDVAEHGEGAFRDWKHASVRDVTNDEVAQLLGE